MDSHLRPYFSSSLIQLDVDALLFSKALESNDAASAKKTLVDLSIPPAGVCKPWQVYVHIDLSRSNAPTISGSCQHLLEPYQLNIYIAYGMSFYLKVRHHS